MAKEKTPEEKDVEISQLKEQIASAHEMLDVLGVPRTVPMRIEPGTKGKPWILTLAGRLSYLRDKLTEKRIFTL